MIRHIVHRQNQKHPQSINNKTKNPKPIHVRNFAIQSKHSSSYLITPSIVQLAQCDPFLWDSTHDGSLSSISCALIHKTNDTKIIGRMICLKIERKLSKMLETLSIEHSQFDHFLLLPEPNKNLLDFL